MEGHKGWGPLLEASLCRAGRWGSVPSGHVGTAEGRLPPDLAQAQPGLSELLLQREGI